MHPKAFPPQTPSGDAPPSEQELTELKRVIGRTVSRRADTIALQEALEAAWQAAIADCLALNRPFQAKALPESDARRAIEEAEQKKRGLEAIQQRAFLAFQNLTENKNKGQIKIGSDLLELISQAKENPGIGKRIAAATQEFLRNESQISKEFLRHFDNTGKEIKQLLAEIERVGNLPCRDRLLNHHIQHDVSLLRKFLQSTEELLSKDGEK